MQIQRLIEDRKQSSFEAATVGTRLQEVQLTLEHQVKQAQMEAEHDRNRLSQAMTQLAAQIAAEERLRVELRSLDSSSRTSRQALEQKLEKAIQQRDEYKSKFEDLSREVVAVKTETDGRGSFEREQLRLAQQRIVDLETQVRLPCKARKTVGKLTDFFGCGSMLKWKSVDSSRWKLPARLTL